MILEEGDLTATEEMLGIKGYNGYRPCRSCKIKGVRMISQRGTIYYVPLTTPDVDHQTRQSYDPRSLRLRTHQHYLHCHAKIDATITKKQRDDLGKYYGIRHFPLLSRVGSIDFAVSFPWEWLHLFCENNIPNLISLTSGTFKNLDMGKEDYEISKQVWDEIGEETTKASDDIPSSFTRRLPNIVKDPSHYTAKSWAFWLIYIAPILLKHRFAHPKYYDHFCLLGKIMKTTLKWELTSQEIDELEEDSDRWVELYEEFVSCSHTHFST
jgi:hypothetical protein